MRTKNSIRNIGAGVIGQLISTAISFISRTIFIKCLGSSYLGVNGLFSNILSILSLAELGVGSAIIYNMYKPLAEKDKEKIIALMKFYEKSYRSIGIFIGLIGLIILPFLDFIIKDKLDIPNISLIYMLFLLDSVVSYFFAYKRSILTADQKNYINVMNQQLFNIIKVILQIIILLMTKNFLLYLIIQIICTFISNLSISIKVDKMYPYLKDKNNYELDKESKTKIFKNVTALMCQKIGSVIVSGTDNILISSFVGVYSVGLYSNYSMIINIINSFLGQITTALTASIGNLNATEKVNKAKEIFEITFFINNWIYSFCSICLLVLIDPFISIWIGNNFIMGKSVVFIIILNFFIKGMRQSTIMYSNTLGLFWQERYKSLIEAFINLVVSIVLLRKLGIVGVFLGTFISTMTTCFWFEPYVVYKYGFKTSVLDYFKRYLSYLVVTGVSTIITYYICSFINVNSFIGIISRLLICIIVPNIIFIIVYCRSKEFNYLFKIIKCILNKIKFNNGLIMNKF